MEDIEENEERLKIYGDLTSNDIDLLKALKITHLDLSELNNSSFSDSRFSNFKFLTSIILPRNLKYLGEQTFYKCNSLSEIVIPKDNNYFCVNESALFNKDKTILYLYFSKEEKKKYYIPDTVKEIKSYAFSDSYLKSIIVPKSVAKLGEYVFINCQSLTSIKFEKGINIEEIPQSTFADCASLKKVHIHKGVINIGVNAFIGCKSLKKIDLPDSIQGIGYKNICLSSLLLLGKNKTQNNVKLICGTTFQGCDSLEEIRVDPKNKFYCDVDGVLFNKDKTVLIKFPENKHVDYYNIPNTVEIIEESAFDSCKFIKQIVQTGEKTKISGELTIPLSLRSIDYNAFRDCKNIRRLKFETEVHISDCFRNCNLIEYVKITRKQLESSNQFLYRFLCGIKKKFIVAIENWFFYCENTSDAVYKSEVNIYGLYSKSLYFAKNAIIDPCDLINYARHKDEVEFKHRSLNILYRFSWVY